jgi:Transposase DDE domain group 1
MQTQCSPTEMDFGRAGGRRVAADFDGGMVSSDAGALLLGEADKAIGLTDRFAACFADRRSPLLTVHALKALVAQRVFGLALGYEDLNDHDDLRGDPVLGVLLGKLDSAGATPGLLAGKSPLNRLEHVPGAGKTPRYHKIDHDAAAIEKLFIDLFLDAHQKAPRQIVLDLDATDDPLHGDQEGRFHHGYYDCYCYLPLYVFCGRHLIAAKLRRSDIDASAGSVEEMERIVGQIRARWPRVKIVLRADSGFAREALMAWCEANTVDYVFGLARNERLEGRIADALDEARLLSQANAGQPARVFRDFDWSTKDSWSRRRRVIAKAEWAQGEANPRFLVTSLKPDAWRAKPLYEKLYCARGEMENRIKECEARPVRRPHLDRHNARQSAAAVVRLDGLCAHLRAAPHRACPYPVRRRDLRHHPPQAPQARRTGQDQRPPRQNRLRLRLSVGPRMADRPSAPRPRPRLASLMPTRRSAPLAASTQGPPETKSQPQKTNAHPAQGSRSPAPNLALPTRLRAQSRLGSVRNAP